ncbi:hypothetical protein EJ02DRAFT_449560 [Clathrospora elynae]|uniref:Uncharacterized protein n=1 Tax=Clathrospora elynae TaxID=706981 RepID=A0A6A5T5E5_9PLEO|nr:hypothetical protein EJ02DRAFT_449560 [Clathrospora elynae]
MTTVTNVHAWQQAATNGNSQSTTTTRYNNNDYKNATSRLFCPSTLTLSFLTLQRSILFPSIWKSREDLKRKLDDIDAKDSNNSYELRSSVLPRKGKFAAPESLPVPATPLDPPLCINCALVMHKDREDCVMPPGKRACTRCSDHLHEACRAIPDELKADVVSLCQLLSVSPPGNFILKSIQSLAKKVAPKLRAAQKKAAQAGARSGYQDNRDGDSAVEGLLRQILHELVALREDVGN